MKNALLRLMNFQNGLIVTLMVALTACIDKTEAPEQTPIGFVNLFNAAPLDGNSLDIYLSDTKINQTPFSYSKNSGYLNFPTGNTTLKFNSYNTTTKLFEATFNVEENKAKSVFVINEGTTFSTLILGDVSPQATTASRVRFVNLSPNPNLKVDLHVKASDLTDSIAFQSVAYKSASEFNHMKSRKYTFILLNSADGTVLTTLEEKSIDPAKYYTVVATGYDPSIIPTGNSNKIVLQVLNN